MRLPRLNKRLSLSPGAESGVTLIETLVALAILSLIVPAFMGALFTVAKATIIADEQATAESLARSQIEWVKNVDNEYAVTEYSLAPIPSGKDYLNYSATIAVEPLDDGIQKIIVTIKHSNKEVIKLEGYKVDR